MTTRRHSNRNVRPRPRDFDLKFKFVNSNTNSAPESIVTPNKGKRIRLIRVRVIQELTAGRRLCELYFGTGADMTVNPEKAVDTVEIPDLGTGETRTFLAGEGPRGERDEVLSRRWHGSPPSSAHTVLIEYTEES